MSGADGERDLLVVDGDLGPELARRGVVLRPSAGAFPISVREPAAVRRALLDVALAGADVLTAATGDQHRRALSRIGAARRSREWVQVTLDLAREARDEAGEAERPGGGDEPARPLRVGGLILPLDGVARPDLSPDAAAALAEHRAHAGLLAESGAEFLRIESMATIAESEAATVAALETGLETWSGVAVDASGRSLRSGEPLESWAGVVAPLGPHSLLIAAPTTDAAVAALGLLGESVSRLGASVSRLGAAVQDPPPGTAERLLAVGATLLSAGADGSPDRVATLRAAVASEARRQAQRRHDDRTRLLAWIGTAAERASAGPALWLGSADPSTPLPARFGWDVATRGELGRLPEARYRLAIAADRAGTPGHLGGGGGRDEPSGGRDEPASGRDGAPGRDGAAGWDSTPRRDGTALGDAGSTGPLTIAEARRLVSSIEPGGWLLAAPGLVDRRSLAADDRLESIEPAPWPESEGGDVGWLARRRP